MCSRLTPGRAIRAKCLDCCCGQVKEVRLCPSETCALWPYRRGKNPARAGIGGKGRAVENADLSADLSAMAADLGE